MAEQNLHTFLFADIAGYTLVADQHGDEAAADLALYFLSRASSLASTHGGEVVKCLGDAVMIRTEHAADSIRIALDLVTEFGRDPALPAIHAGLHTGPAVRRADDWWGATVRRRGRLRRAGARDRDVQAPGRSDRVYPLARPRAASAEEHPHAGQGLRGVPRSGAPPGPRSGPCPRVSASGGPGGDGMIVSRR
jgi:class 3 adenylate cyclase